VKKVIPMEFSRSKSRLPGHLKGQKPSKTVWWEKKKRKGFRKRTKGNKGRYDYSHLLFRASSKKTS